MTVHVQGMDPRWKGKNNAAIAESNPMSQIVSQLQSSLAASEMSAMLSGCDSLFEATPELTDLLNRSCFGREISTCEKGKQWFQFGLEEAFYLHYKLQALTVITANGRIMDGLELWRYMKSKLSWFPEFYKAYAHLRSKNWVVRSGTQYGGDFVVYRHHPALIHSEYVVLVMAEGGSGSDDVSTARFRTWSDMQRGLRVSGSVAKTLLLLSVNKNGSDVDLPSCLEQFSVEENVIRRWVPEQCRENSLSMKKGVLEENREESCADEVS